MTPNETDSPPAVSRGDCNANCPRFLPQWHCCRGCGHARRAFYEQASDEIKSLWAEPLGFWDPQHGCRLDRARRPAECRDYDCAERIFLVASARWQGKWPLVIGDLARRTATEEEFVGEARRIWQELHERALVEEAPAATSWERAAQFCDGPTLFMLHGLLASGKSSWAGEFVRRCPRVRIVSADGFRRMLHGQYEYHAEMDELITASMVAALRELWRAGYDAVIDCGNLTAERREPWLAAAEACGAKKVAVVLPRRHKDWHILRRLASPHGEGKDWRKIYEGEAAALEPLAEARFDALVQVSAPEVSRQKILILSASPVRDKHIDNLIAERLRARGHQVEVAPCLREGRDKVLAYRPDVCLVPPIRNPNSRDFVAELKRFGCGVITRHTEPSCSWQDWKKMGDKARMEILGPFRYAVDLELVWGDDEADILNRRGWGFRAVPVGAIGLDIYFDEKLKSSLANRPAFYGKYKLDLAKTTLLISSPWGFADSSPDLHTDDMEVAKRDRAGRDRHFEMIRKVYAILKDKWNVLLTVHAGVGSGPYQALAKELGVPLETEAPMLDLLPNCDALVHAGSTAAVSAHLLGVPAFQYGDVNAGGSDNWWGVGESAISRVSPSSATPEALAQAILSVPVGSNANLETIGELQSGRYGRIDGKATDRAVVQIEQVFGRFRYAWPRAPHDYRQLTIQRRPEEFYRQVLCNVCHEEFCVLTDEYVRQLATTLGVDPEKLRPHMGMSCPHCAARMFQLTM